MYKTSAKVATTPTSAAKGENMAGTWYDVEPKQQDLNDRNTVDVDK